MSYYSSKLTRKERRSSIVGMLLGDGSLYRSSPTSNANLSITHSIKQQEYLEWKRSIIQPMFGYDLPITHTYNSAGNGKRYPVVRLVTRVNSQLTQLHKKMYRPKKIVTPELLDLLDDRGMAIWYLDDGCLSTTTGRGAYVILSTNSFTYNENELIRNWIYDRYGVSFNINKSNGTYCLRRGISDAHKLLDAIEPFVTVPCMRYKVEYPAPKRGSWYNLPTTVPGTPLG